MKARNPSLLALVAVLGCSPEGAPSLDVPSLVRAFTGSEVEIEASASDPDDDVLGFSVRAPDIRGFAERATLTQVARSRAILKFTPSGDEVGRVAIDFRVSDGTHEDVARSIVEVLPAAGAFGSPVFVSPLGDGTTIDLERTDCVDLELVVNDPDSTDVDIQMAEPLLEGAELSRQGPQAVRLSWCPTESQQLEAEHYAVTLVADDGVNAPTRKRYKLVLRSPLKPICGGDPPRIDHVPIQTHVGLANLAVEATVEDDLGLKHPPIVYFRLSRPEDVRNPDLAEFSQVEMVSVGEARWHAEIPNPLATDTVAPRRSVYYQIVAQDNDDPLGDCDHRTVVPAAGVYEVKVTRDARGEGNVPVDARAPLCSSCSTDAQCGPGSACVLFGGVGGSFCVPTCNGGCPAGTACSPTPIPSVGGRAEPRCLPSTGACGAEPAPPACRDDRREPNDAPSVASPITPGEHGGLVLCPSGSTGANEDFFSLHMDEPSRIHVAVGGEANGADVDVSLRDADGRALTGSFGNGDDERFDRAVPAGDYTVRVFSPEGTLDGPAPYTLVVGATPGGNGCEDGLEPNDSFDEATRASARYDRSGLELCGADEDWFSLDLEASDHVVVDLGCPADAEEENDLDVYLVDPDGRELTPCCDVTNGQSEACSEHFEWTVASGGQYRVVAMPYAGSGTQYSISIRVTEGQLCEARGCPSGDVCGPAGCVDDSCQAVDSDFDGFFFEQSDCPWGHFCPEPGPGDGVSHCVRDCWEDADCLPGTVCKVFDTVGGCAEAGHAGVGAPCDDFTDCEDALGCLPSPGGYCTLSDCDSTGDYSGPCPFGSACIPVEDWRFGLGVAWICLETCLGDGDCRDGYECVDAEDDIGDETRVCA